MTPPPRPPTDYRRSRQQADRVYLWLVVAALLIIGGGLVFFNYGGWAFATAFLCLFAGSGVILLLWALLTLIERWVGD